ncbi:MAG: TonB-dependent receptor, partial [Opitutales bacterium]|nr:TonB-dependent receptor [Opitutales bacterium]
MQRILMGCLSGSMAVSLTAQTGMEPYVDEDVYILSPFEVNAGETMGYVATTSLAGTRIKTELRDVGSAISVVTAEFIKDTGATDNESLLIYTANTEVGGVLGNFSGASIGAMANETANFARPSTNTRVRGLAAADNTRDFFVTEIPWDSYVIDRVD